MQKHLCLIGNCIPLLVLTLAALAQAATYYVDSVNGVDPPVPGAGTTTYTAWKTLQWVAWVGADDFAWLGLAFSPGDNILRNYLVDIQNQLALFHFCPDFLGINLHNQRYCLFHIQRP